VRPAILVLSLLGVLVFGAAFALSWALREQLPRKVANVVADMLDADCECRRRLVGLYEGAAQERLCSLRGVQQRLTTLVESSYASVRSALLVSTQIVNAALNVVGTAATVVPC
jgi:hypothetical protein